MRHPAVALIALIGLHAASPAAAAGQPNAEIGCASLTQSEHPRSGTGTTPPATTARSPAYTECDVDSGPTQADLQIYGLFILGMLIIGIPAIRRRQARVVFS